jgi:7-cyano-7-deazaguanine synthase in queuosine biosynthesis
MLSEVLGVQGEKRLEDKPNEDIELLNILDTFLIKRRGYVVKMPSEGSAVAVCMSGGADSIVNIDILLREFKLNVYPFFVDRGQKNYVYEKQAVDYFDSLFHKNYPDLYHPVREIQVTTPGLVYKSLLTHELTKDHISYPSRNSIIFLTGAEYAYSLRTEGVNIHHLFAAHVSSDTSMHCSLTWTRLTNLTICHIMNDYQWQFISIPIERELGNFYDKDVLVRYAQQHDLPLELTRTCVMSSEIQCGKCPCCWDRRRCFAEAGIKDATSYLHPMPENQPIKYEQ